MKLCKDCKYYANKYPDIIKGAGDLCIIYSISRIDGMRFNPKNYYRACNKMRSKNKRCGMNAKWFELKEIK